MGRGLVLFALVLAALGGQVAPCLAGSSSGQAGARPMGDAALLPPDSAVAPWKRVDNLRVFTRADLYGYIDGGAELFLEFGFDQLTLQKYRSGTNELAVEIYRMTDAPAALGIYLLKCGKEVREPSFKDRHTLNRHQLMFTRDRYYVTISNLSGAEAVGPDLVRFGVQVASKLPMSVPSPDLKRLPPQGLVAGSERLIRGPFALQSLYTLGDDDILRLGRRIVAVAGNYSTPSAGAHTRILVTYPDAAAARQAFDHVVRNLDRYLKPVTTAPTRLVFKDYENKFGVITLNGTLLEVVVHLARQPQ